MALTHTAASVAVDAVAGGPSQPVDAAVAAAHRAMLARLLPLQQAAIDAAYHAALARIPEGPARAAGIAAGERAAAATLARRADDTVASESYRPHTSPGAYVPTAAAAASQWPQRKPWLMASAAQFRPGPPPALESEVWARDYNEVKALGARASIRRTAEQTDIARFWEYSLPAIYFGVVRAVAQLPGRDPARNARLYAAAVGAVLAAEVGEGAMPVLSTTSPTAKGVVRRWTNVEEFIAEVATARIHEGIHYRTSTEVGADMGWRIGAAAAGTLTTSH